MENLDEMDEFITIDLQPRAAVVDRLVVLRALVERSLLEAVAEQEGHTNDVEERRFDLLAELLASSAGSALTPEELQLLQVPIGQLPDEESTPMILAAEAFGAIGHACGLLRELPLPPVPVGGSEELLEHILSLSVEDIEANTTLPSDEEAALLLEVIEVVHWRVDVEFGARLDGGELTCRREGIDRISRQRSRAFRSLPDLSQRRPAYRQQTGSKMVGRGSRDVLRRHAATAGCAGLALLERSGLGRDFRRRGVAVEPCSGIRDELTNQLGRLHAVDLDPTADIDMCRTHALDRVRHVLGFQPACQHDRERGRQAARLAPSRPISRCPRFDQGGTRRP